MLRSLFFILISLSSLSSVSGTIVDCGKGLSLFKFTNLALTPDPPIAGQDIYMTVQFENPGPSITSGSVTSSFTLNGLPFSPTVEDLCTNTQCPLITGFNDRSAISTWPTGLSGKIQSRISWTDILGNELLCIEITEKMFRLRGSLKRYTPVNITTLNQNQTQNQTRIQETRVQKISNSTALVLYIPKKNKKCPLYINSSTIWDQYHNLERMWGSSHLFRRLHLENEL